MFVLTSGPGLTWFSLLLFLQCDPLITPAGSGVLADPTRIDEEFRKRLGFPTFCRSGQRETSLEEFTRGVDGWLPFLPEVSLPRLTGVLRLFDVRVLLLVVWMAGVGGSSRFYRLPGLMVLLVFYLRWRILEFGQRFCLTLILL